MTCTANQETFTNTIVTFYTRETNRNLQKNIKTTSKHSIVENKNLIVHNMSLKKITFSKNKY